jgi:5-oxoprolinase (ATP-hydrolysing)
MPVHLGSMGESVRTILRLRGAEMREGDVYALNNPTTAARTFPT